ncbi:MAG: 3-hydroxyacyl-CoA dehydrogenase [Acetobacteraceae bacterium]|nr:3-hydroxyacyl-CoA dehydrogenase [Acetobacteraceae bacterium]
MSEKARPVGALVSAGSIGIGWAVVFARAGHPVRLHDVSAGALARAADAARGRLEMLAEEALLDEAPGAVAARITTSPDLAQAVAGAALVLEQVPEKPELKRAVFSELDRLAPADAVLASSSSSIPASVFAEGLAGRARCLVAHPGNPPFLIPVVEIVPAPFTAPEAAGRLRALMEQAGQTPVMLRREVRGFVYNRLQGAVLREAYCLLRDGVISVADLDRIVTHGLGLRYSLIGPFETSDLNYRGGLAEHAERMGANYAAMGAERGQNDPWTPDLVAKAVAERRALLPLERWEERVAWRDRELMALLRFRRARGL